MASDTDIERIARIEAKLEYIQGEWCRNSALLKDLHQDMIERRMAFSVVKTTSRYIIWFALGILSIIGVAKAPALADWYDKIPR